MKGAISTFDLAPKKEDALRVSVESGGIGTWDYYPLTGELRWSARTKELAGLSPEADASYDHFISSLHPEDRDRVEKEVNQALNSKSGGGYRVEYRAIGFDKVERWLLVQGRVFFNPRGDPIRFTGTVIDISAQKKAEGAARKMADELKRSNEDLKNFASILAHDLKAPLRMVTSFLKLLSERGVAGKDRGEFLQYAVFGASQMKSLIDALYTFSLVDQGGPFLGIVDCSEVLEKVLPSLRHLIDESQAELTCEPLPRVKGDAVLLGLVFQNLIDNAIKFKGGSPLKIQITAEQKGREWIFSVRDNGIGFSMENAERIFFLFQRLCGREGPGGTGVGLAICKKIIERHGGRIWAESSPGKGSTFYFKLATAGLA